MKFVCPICKYEEDEDEEVKELVELEEGKLIFCPQCASWILNTIIGWKKINAGIMALWWLDLKKRLENAKGDEKEKVIIVLNTMDDIEESSEYD